MVKWSPDKCLPNREVYVFNLAWAAADPREKGLTEFDLVTERKRKPGANLTPKPRTGQTDLFEPLSNAKTSASPDLKDLVQINK